MIETHYPAVTYCHSEERRDEESGECDCSDSQIPLLPPKDRNDMMNVSRAITVRHIGRLISNTMNRVIGGQDPKF